MRTLESSTTVAVVFAVMDEDIFDRAPVGLAQQIRSTIADTEDHVAIDLAVELVDALEARSLESRHRFFHALATRRPDDDQGHSVSLRRAARRSGMPSLTISSTGA